MKITDLNPKLVWEIFDEITQVPRPTHHLDKMREFLLGWAARHGLEAKADEVGNVLIRAAATPGCENAPTVVMQGHQDMVAEKLPGVKHDFLTDPIQTETDGKWVRAKGTTLGADNGLGCATAMAALIDPTFTHGPLEALLTVDEEQGLIGANGLKEGFITGNILLNLDSEEMGSLVIGCAGGKVTEISLPVRFQDAPAGCRAFKVGIGGLKGGHSGMEINLGRANANRQLARFLWQAGRDVDWQLAAIDGGGLANAIPRDAHAVVLVPEDKAEEFAALAVKFHDTLHEEYDAVENKDFSFAATPCEAPARIMEPVAAHRLVSALFACPGGVQAMSADIPGLVETSCNLASVKMEGDNVHVTVHQRSSVDSRRDEIADRVAALFTMIGADVAFDDAYVGWRPDTESHVLKVAESSYEHLFGTAPKVEALHAGLECGLFLEKMPSLDMVSFGPTLKDIHSPGEKADVESVGRFYDLLREILLRLSRGE